MMLGSAAGLEPANLWPSGIYSLSTLESSSRIAMLLEGMSTNSTTLTEGSISDA